MKPPTKFQLMRRNRDRLHERQVWMGIAADAWQPEPAPAQDPTPAVPTMEIDGVKYREADGKFASCDGCDFYVGGYECALEEGGLVRFAVEAFGSTCAARQVIYIKAA